MQTPPPRPARGVSYAMLPEEQGSPPQEPATRGKRSGSLRRTLASRPASAVAGALGAVVNGVGVGLSHARDLGSRALPSIASWIRPSDGRLQLAQQRSPARGGGVDVPSAPRLVRRQQTGLRPPGQSPAGAGARHVTPVSTTVVQDSVKCINLSRFFSACVRPPRSRRRARFASQRALAARGAAGCEAAVKACGTDGGAGVGPGGSPLTNGGARPVYVQVRSGRQLTWPWFQGSVHTCYCMLLVGGAPRGHTQSVAVAGEVKNATWNEVFSFPRALMEAPCTAGRVVFQVWSTDQYGDDYLVGQAELGLGPMLAAERPHPLATTLELQAIDEDTGHPEPGSCGELVVAAWTELAETGPRPCQPTSGGGSCMLSAALAAAAAPLVDPREAGVLTSNLSAPCGSKTPPLVVHSPMGTLYEEPCINVIKITINALVDLNFEFLASSAQQGGIAKRRVRLDVPGQLRAAIDNVKEKAAATAAAAAGPAAVVGGGLGGGAGAAGGKQQQGTLFPPEELPNASTATRRQLSSLLKTAFTRRRPRPLQQQVSAAAASSHTSESPFVTPTAASGAVSTSPDAVPAAAAPPPSPPAAAAVGVSSVVAAAGRGVIGGLTAVTGAAARVTAAALPIRRRRSTSGGGGGFGARRLSTDELMDDDDGGGGRGGGGAEGDGDASVMPGTTLVLDELDDNASSTLVPSAAAMTEAGGTGPGSGPGAFCYFKVSLDKQSHKGRMRWLSAAPTADPSTANDPLAPTVHKLLPSTFVFVLPRPLPNAQLSLSLYVTNSARRRGRVVGRTTVELYDVLERTEGAVSGKPLDVVYRFDDHELGSVRMAVQIADTDSRATLYRVPLVADPSRLPPDMAGLGMGMGPGMGPGPGPGMALVSGGGPGSVGDGAGAELGPLGGGGGRGAGALGPVLADTKLLQDVLVKSGVEPDVEDLFVRSYLRLGSAKTGGGLLPEDLTAALQAYGASAATSLDRAFDILKRATNGRANGQPLFDSAHSQQMRNGSNQPASSSDGSDLFGAVPPLPPHVTPDPASNARALGSPIRSGAVNGPNDFAQRLAAVAGITSNGGGAPLGTSSVRKGQGSTTSGGAVGPGVGAGANGGVVKPTCGRLVLGSLLLRISPVNVAGVIKDAYCFVVKCGPHWIRTADRHPSEAMGSGPVWQVVIPLYDPATILTVGIFTNTTKSVMGLTFNDSLIPVARLRVKLSTLNPFRPSWHVLDMRQGEGLPAKDGSAAPGGGTGGAAISSAAPLIGRLGVRLQYPSLSGLLMSYLAAADPESMYELELEEAEERRMRQDCRKAAESWLAAAQPPIPPTATRLLTDDGRSTFDFGQTKANWRRIEEGMRLLSRLNAWFKHICSWKDPRASWEVVFCIALLCYYPSTAIRLFMVMLALEGVKRRRVVLCPATAGAAAGPCTAAAAAASLLSPMASALNAQPGGAATAPWQQSAAGVSAGGGGPGALASGGGAAAAGAAGGGGGLPPGPLGGPVAVQSAPSSATVGASSVATTATTAAASGGGGGGGDDDSGEGAQVPTGTLAEFKRKVSSLVELALVLQNLFDTVASLFERLQAVLSFQDVVASWLFVVACCLVFVLVQLLGLRTAFFAALLWQVRPPCLQDALPAPPVAYFQRLPCRSTIEVA